ncbi:MAG TPA: TolC family protein [Longimicrobiales bacterium]|nr:TolC family protein [Longimicrobiales bacterium]
MTHRTRIIRAGWPGLALPLALLGFPGPAEGQLTVTLEEALQRALVRSPTMVQQEQAVESAAWTQRQAWGAFLPSLSASSGGSLRSTQRFDQATDRIVEGSSDSYSAGLSSSITLFDGGRMFANLSGARADYRAAEARRDNQLAQVSLQTKNLFFAALRQADLLAVAQERVRQAGESLDMVRTQTRVGTATSSDSLRARLELINARQSALQAENSTRAARYALGRQIGESNEAIPVRPESLEPTPLPLSDEEILQLAEAQSPSVIAAEEATRSAAYDVRDAKGQYIPSFRLSSGYSWANQDRSFAGGTTSWNLNLSVSLPIFNGFSREGTLERAQFTQRLARLQEDDARLAARQQADGALQDVRTAEQAIVIAEEALNVAEEDLRVIRERYRVGVATVLELVSSQIAVVQAGATAVTARYDYVLARAQLEAVLGRGL